MWALAYILVILACFKNCVSVSDLGSHYELLEKRLKWPTVYHMRGEEIDMRVGTMQSFEIWYSADLNRSRIDYDGGINKEYYYGATTNDTGLRYKIRPETTEQYTNEIVCKEFPDSDKPRNFLPLVTSLRFAGTKIISNRTLQIWKLSISYKSLGIERKLLAYVRDGVHVPVQTLLKLYNLDTGSVTSHIITNYYGYESTFDMNVLDVEYEHNNCEQSDDFGKSLNDDLKYIHSGVYAHSDFAFQRYKEHHNRNYYGDEHVIRQQIFHKNWKYITEHNKKNLGYKLELNQFADRTEDELQFLSGTIPSIQVADSNLYSESLKWTESVNELPEEFDMRFEGVIGQVKNDGDCGASWAFSVTAAVEGALARKNGGRNLDLSEQSLIDCSWGFGNEGCVNGTTEGALKYVLAHGIPTEQEYGPYLDKEGVCKIRNMSRVYAITGFGKVTPRNVEALKAALYKYGPVVVNVYAGHNMISYSNGIFYDIDCEGESVNHAVTVVGYGVRDGSSYWIVKNSWGAAWGEDGYILISTTNNNCLLLDVGYYPIV